MALDMGDVWIGSAISDPLMITCKPYKTIKKDDALNFIYENIEHNDVKIIVTGIPYTMSGVKGTQAKKTEQYVLEIRQNLDSLDLNNKVEWATWDERKTSKYAQQLMQGKKKHTQKKIKKFKTQEHSVAAAFILQGYLDHRSSQEGRI